MKHFWKQHHKLHLWLLIDLALLLLFLLLRRCRPAMEHISSAMASVRCTIGRLCTKTSISIMEVLCVLLTVFTVVYLIWNAAAILRAKGRRLHRAYSALLGAGCIVLTIYLGFCWIWGINFYIDGFQDQSGIRAEPVAVEDLAAVTRYFAERLEETADAVPRDAQEHFSVPREEILAAGVDAYSVLDDTYPQLAFPDTPPKAVHFSGIMSLLDFTGVYCPYTGESNVNVASPACLLPSTVAHELAHQRGYTSEQECNFLAILASTTCGRTDYAYSGWLLGYIYLGNALYRADHDAWEAVYTSLPESVRADLSDNNAYWAPYRTSTVKKVSNTVYESFLKSYGEERGLQSYGTVVDLLVVYYK